MRCRHYNIGAQCTCEDRLMKTGEGEKPEGFRIQPHLACMGKLPSSCEWYDAIHM